MSSENILKSYWLRLLLDISFCFYKFHKTLFTLMTINNKPNNLKKKNKNNNKILLTV